MATAALISVDEYLSTSYRPDQDFLDGELVERNLGEYDHSNLQRALVGWLFQREREWNIRALPEQRVKVGGRRFRIPDVCVISRDASPEPVLSQPPLICIEVLSKDDTLRSMQERISDYRALGVPNIWVLDPVKRLAYVCQDGGFIEAAGALQVAHSPIEIPLAELWEQLA